MGGPWGPVVAGRGEDVAGGGRRSIGASVGRGWEGRGCRNGFGGAVSPGSVCMVTLAWRGRVWAVLAGWASRLGCARCPGPLCSCSPVCSRGLLCGMSAVLGHLAPVHRCACLVWCVACAASRAPWLPFTVCPVGVLCCLCGVLGHLAPAHRCSRSVCCFACSVSLVSWLLFTGVLALSFVFFVQCPGPLGSCSPVCPLGVLCCVCGVLGPIGPRSPVCPVGALCCMCGVLGHLTPVHRCAPSVCCFACAVFWATWLLFTGVPALSFVLFVRCPEPLGSCSPVCPLGVLCCVCGVLGLLAPVHRCARPWCPVPLLPSVHARVQCPGPRGACSPVCALCAVRVCRWWLCPSSSPPNLTVAGLGSVPLGVAVPVVVCVGVLQLPLCLVSSGRGLAWHPEAVAGWVTGLGGGAAGWGVRRVVLCGAQGSWGAVGAAGVGAPTLVGW